MITKTAKVTDQIREHVNRAHDALSNSEPTASVPRAYSCGRSFKLHRSRPHAKSYRKQLRLLSGQGGS
jgi:hypothetical protein